MDVALPTIRIGRCRRIHVQDLEAFAERLREAGSLAALLEEAGHEGRRAR
jgi:hypothetical protein